MSCCPWGGFPAGTPGTRSGRPRAPPGEAGVEGLVSGRPRRTGRRHRVPVEDTGGRGLPEAGPGTSWRLLRAGHGDLHPTSSAIQGLSASKDALRGRQAGVRGLEPELPASRTARAGPRRSSGQGQGLQSVSACQAGQSTWVPPSILRTPYLLRALSGTEARHCAVNMAFSDWRANPARSAIPLLAREIPHRSTPSPYKMRPRTPYLPTQLHSPSLALFLLSNPAALSTTSPARPLLALLPVALPTREPPESF